MNHRNAQSIFRTLVAGAFFTITAGAVEATDALEQYQPPVIVKAERALERGMPERTLALLAGQEEQFVNQRDREAIAGLRCEALIGAGDPAAAVDACTTAIETRSGGTSWRHHNNLGVAYLQLGQYGPAEQSFRNARVLSPRSTEPRRNLRALAEHREANQFPISHLATPNR